MASIIPASIGNNIASQQHRDDGTQIWHQTGQKSDVISIDMYGRVQGPSGGPSSAANARSIVFTPAPIEINDFKGSTYKPHFYQIGYSQQPTLYTTSDIYQAPITYVAASIPPPSGGAVNQHNQQLAYNPVAVVAIPSSNGVGTFSHPPPPPTQIAQSSQQQNSMHSRGPHSQGYMPPFMQQNFYMGSAAFVSGNNNSNYNQNHNRSNQTVLAFLPSSSKFSNKSQTNNTIKQNGNPKLTMFDSCSENYTERWVNSTASIPQDLKLLPDQDQALISPTDYQHDQVLTNSWVCGRTGELQHHTSVDEFAAASSTFLPNADRGMEQQNKPAEQQNNRFLNSNLYTSGQRQNYNVNLRNNNRHFSSQYQPKKNCSNNGVEQNHLNYRSSSYSSVPGTAFYSRDYPQTMGTVGPLQPVVARIDVRNTENGDNAINFNSNDNSVENTLKGGGDLAESVASIRENISRDAISATTSNGAGTTWADMVKRSGNCSIGETRLCAAPVLSFVNKPASNGETELLQNGNNNRNGVIKEEGNSRSQRPANRNYIPNGDRVKNHNNNRNTNGFNPGNKTNNRNRTYQHDTQYADNNNFAKSREANCLAQHGKDLTTNSPTKPNIFYTSNPINGKLNQNGIVSAYPVASLQQHNPISMGGLGISPSLPPPSLSVFNASVVPPNYTVTSENFSNIQVPTTVPHMNKYSSNAITTPILMPSSIALGNQPASILPYSVGQNFSVGWVEQSAPQQQSGSEHLQPNTRSNLQLNQPSAGTLLISQPSPHVILAHPPVPNSLNGASYSANSILPIMPAPVPALQFPSTNSVQSLPIFICPPNGTAISAGLTTHANDDKFRNMWLSEEFVPASQVSNERYISNFVVAHNNAVMVFKDANAKDPNSQQHASTSLLSTAVQMINMSKHSNCNVEPRSSAFYLAGSDPNHAQLKFESKNGKGNRHHRHSVDGAQSGPYSGVRGSPANNANYTNKRQFNKREGNRALQCNNTKNHTESSNSTLNVSKTAIKENENNDLTTTTTNTIVVDADKSKHNKNNFEPVSDNKAANNLPTETDEAEKPLMAKTSTADCAIQRGDKTPKLVVGAAESD